jgi:crotonobetainyl-CoA:carnitine CoA-transferase CaiB-like acyl-CoA transferase
MNARPDLIGPLDGIVVADFSQLVQGPFATQILGDLGADVIKIEPTQGDWMRNYALENAYPGGESISFLAFNRNKRSITLNLKNPSGLELAQKLIDRADVLVENFRPGVMERLGLAFEELTRRNPRLVYCRSSGYGSSGPYVTRPGQDLLIQALTGFMYLNGRADDPPVPVGMGIADLVTGLGIVYAVLAALVGRARTGHGQLVETDLMSSLLAIQSQEVAAYISTGRLPERSAAGVSSPSVGAPYGVHPTSDGYIAIAMTPLSKLGPLLGLDQYADSTSLNDMGDRDAIQREISAAFRTKVTAEWLELLLAEDVWCAPVLDYEGMTRDPQVAHNEMLIEFDHPTAGPTRVPGMPVRFAATPTTVRRPPPLKGEHTDEILYELLGLSQSEIATIRRTGAVGEPHQPADSTEH